MTLRRTHRNRSLNSPGYMPASEKRIDGLPPRVKVTTRAMSAGREARVKKDANLSIVSSGYLVGKDSPPYPVRPGLIMDGKIGINGKNVGPFFEVVNVRFAGERQGAKNHVDAI